MTRYSCFITSVDDFCAIDHGHLKEQSVCSHHVRHDFFLGCSSAREIRERICEDEDRTAGSPSGCAADCTYRNADCVSHRKATTLALAKGHLRHPVRNGKSDRCGCESKVTYPNLGNKRPSRNSTRSPREVIYGHSTCLIENSLMPSTLSSLSTQRSTPMFLPSSLSACSVYYSIAASSSSACTSQGYSG